MRRSLLSFVACALLAPYSHARRQPGQATVQTAAQPQRDPQAVAIVQQAVKVMGGTAPTDSTAMGAVNLVAGSQSETGTITILTKGSAETSEQINLPSGQRVVVYSNGLASEITPTSSGQVIMELALADQCADFPLPLLLAALGNSDESFQYIGQESLNGAGVQHVRMSNSFASRPRLARLTLFSAVDVWFDPGSGLLVKLANMRRPGGGSVPGAPVELRYSNYANFGGVLYPMQIQKSYNGTPWQTISIQSVVLDSGLTDAPFQVQAQ